VGADQDPPVGQSVYGDTFVGLQFVVGEELTEIESVDPDDHARNVGLRVGEQLVAHRDHQSVQFAFSPVDGAHTAGGDLGDRVVDQFDVGPVEGLQKRVGQRG